MTGPDIDPDDRPTGYFRPQRLEQYLLSKVKGEVVRARLTSLFEAGRCADVRELAGLSADDGRALEALHPMFMGGNYLPDTGSGEVEIARICIASTTCDVTCVYARMEGGVIRYRVVDEYGGETLRSPGTAESVQPMTLGELVDLFLRAWPLVEVLEDNFPGDLSGALDFFEATSGFYPDLDRVCRERVRAHYASPGAATHSAVDGNAGDG